MKTAIIITQSRLNLGLIAESFHGDGIVAETKDRIVVEMPNGWFALRADDVLFNDYDEEEIRLLGQTFTTFSFAVLEFSTIEAANLAIARMNVPHDSLIDNDHGNILNIEIIRHLIQESVDWYCQLDENEG